MVNSTNLKEKCPRCSQGTMITDVNTERKFCSRCGYVISDRVEEAGPEWRSFSNEGENKSSKSQSHEPVDRNFQQAFIELERLQYKLAVSDVVIEKAAYIYRKILEKRLVGSRPILTWIASALYAACKYTETPRTLKDIEQASNIRRKDIARCYRLLKEINQR